MPSNSALVDRRSSASDYIRFLQAWFRRPRQTASIVPSSPHLGRLMAAQIDPLGGRVMELGGGTGALTREIVATGLPADQLEIVEINREFARDLRRSFPGAAILETSAETVTQVAAGEPGSYQCIISGLPLLAINKDTQRAILSEAFTLLRPGGAFVQFTYSPRPPANCAVADGLDLYAEKIGTIVRNVPPATVFAYRRRADLARD